MDFITHTLVGTGTMRMMTPRADWRARLAPAAFLGSNLMDFDSWVALFGPNFYGKYHRTVSHSMVGLAVITCIAAIAAWRISKVKRWQRFGWFVIPNLTRDPDESSGDPPLALIFLLCAMGAVLHWFGDVITGFGNMKPFWPWSEWDASLHAVFSFDIVLFSMTLGWHLFTRNKEPSLRTERGIGAAYFTLATCYVVGRLIWGTRTFV